MYPPVDTEFYRLPDERAHPRRPFFLVVSALVPYKKVDVAIAACQTAGAALKIVGKGPELPRLRRMADANVEFLGWRSDEEVRELYQQATAVLLPGIEDFGMVPVEAQACGCPVIALGRGGATETVADGTTGVLVRDGSPDAFAAALRQSTALHFDPAAIRQHALRFSRDRFEREFTTVVEGVLGAPSVPQDVHGRGYGPKSRPTK